MYNLSNNKISDEYEDITYESNVQKYPSSTENQGSSCSPSLGPIRTQADILECVPELWKEYG
jgi:hypothetical protein